MSGTRNVASGAAREALAAGDHRQAAVAAGEALARAEATAPEREAAEQVQAALRIDPWALAAGALMIGVVGVLAFLNVHTAA